MPLRHICASRKFSSPNEVSGKNPALRVGAKRSCQHQSLPRDGHWRTGTVLAFGKQADPQAFQICKRKSLEYKIAMDRYPDADLKFLMCDYAAHLEHHLNQIKNF